jgi:hypothetical protein
MSLTGGFRTYGNGIHGVEMFFVIINTLEASPHIRIDLDRYCGKEITEVAESAFGSVGRRLVEARLVF